MKQNQAAMLAVCALLLFCVFAAGCSGPTPSPTATPTPSPTATPTPSPTATPTPSPSPTARPAGLTVLFFYKPDCPYCQAFESTSSFAQLQKKVHVQWIVSDQSTLTDQYGVTTDPTLILLKNGAEVGRWVTPTDATGVLAQINAG